MRAWNAALIVAALGIAAFLLVACAGGRGNGRVTTERRELPAFSSISVGGSGKLHVKKGDFKVLVVTDSNLQSAVLTAVRGSTLYIGVKPGQTLFWPTRLEYEVSLPDLEGLSLSGSADADSEAFAGPALDCRISGSGSLSGPFSYEKARVEMSGSGSLDLDGSFGSLELGVSGSGRARLSGKASELRAELSGSGSLEGGDFSADRVRVGVSGSGSASVRARESLEARLSGSGQLRYWGTPKLDARSSGSGSIKRAGD